MIPPSPIPQRVPAGRPAVGFLRWILLPVLGGFLVAMAAAFPAVQRWRSQAELSRLASEHYSFFYEAEDFSAEEVRRFAEGRERAWQQMAARLEAEAPSEKIRFYLYSSYEQKAGRGHGRGEFNADPEQTTVAAIWNETLPRVELLPDALVLVRQVWGKAAHPFLALSAAAYAAGSWRDQPTEAWGPQITFEEGPYTLAFLANADSTTGRHGDFLSPLVRRPLAGEFARWVIMRWGLAAFRQLYSSSRSPVVAEAALSLRLPGEQLESQWRQWLTQRAKGYSPQPAALVPRKPFFQRGVAFTQEYGRRGGNYASARMGEVLGHLKRLGVDAISVVPFSFMPGPDVPELIRYSGERDEGINNTTFRAHRLGMKVMLKPQIWLRGGLFPGDVRFRSSRDRKLWFSRYRQWILHNARLAEWNGSDLFCIGNELREMTRHESEWRNLIATVRRIYHGPLTYAAHWGKEFETLGFWDALDYIGLNNYYPLSRDGDATAAALQRGAQSVVRRVERVQQRWRRPVILTEVGFPSRRGGVAEPWNERPSTVIDTQEQARCYEAIFQSFYGKPWFYGMYWWKWYSTGYGGGPDDGRFTPMNKPAAEVMAKWFLKPAAEGSPAGAADP